MNTLRQPRLTYENRVVAILTLVGGVSAMDLLAFNFLGPFIAADMKLSSGTIGMIAGVSMLAWSISGITTSLVSDRIGRRRIFLVLGLLGFGIMSMGTALATSVGTLLIARFVVGFSEGPIVPMESAIMHAESTTHRRGLNIGIVQNFGVQLVGGIVGPLVLVGIAAQLGWRYAFVIAAIPAFIMAVVVQFGIREPAVPVPTGPQPSVWSSIKSIAAVHNIRVCFVIAVFSIGWITTMSIFIPLWLINHLKFTPFGLSVVLACLGIGGAIGSVVVPGLSDRLGRRPMLVWFALSGLLLPVGLLFGSTSLVVVSCIALTGRLFAGIMPLFVAIIPMESVDPRQGATALSLLIGCAQIFGGMIGPVLAGGLADRYSLAAPFWLTIVLALCAALVGLLIHETAPARVRQPDADRAKL